jgi:hypothetical protein
MNVFEDLVDELKEENLLENTVMDMAANPSPSKLADRFAAFSDHHYSSESNGAGIRDTAAGVPPAAPSVPEVGSQFEATSVVSPETNHEYPVAVPLAEPGTAESADIQFHGDGEPIEIRKAESDREFFKKRAIAEMSSLKMVEAVLSAVEREQLKTIPNPYDDLEAKKALHDFLQVAGDESGDVHKQAEFRLLNETETWCSALAARDRNISVASLRRYCETCRPMLSSQAMLAIARFYRNLPYSETVRGKFDFIITRLFSRPMEDETRKLLFSPDEMLGHIKTLYADWSSVPLYTADEDESKILLTALSFEELSAEAEAAVCFDDLIKSDFFGRLRLFKESIAELFFAPIVTSAAMACNIRIGNVYVKLIDLERCKMDAASIHQRFGDLDDQEVSEAAGRTLELVEILRERANSPLEDLEYEDEKAVVIEDPEAVTEDKKGEAADTEKVHYEGTFFQRMKEQLLSVNRLLLAASFLLIAASVGIYVWAGYYAEPQVSTTGVKTLSFQGTDLGENVKTAKLSGETLYIVAQPTVDSMTKDKQAELLQKFYQAGKGNGWLNVNLMNSEGRTIGYASPTRSEVTGPR